MTTITTGQVVSASAINQWAPPGAIILYAGSTAPSGWFLCDGSAISRTTYSDLYAVIGTTYGIGDGSTTFNLPDCRGRVGVGCQAGGGHPDIALGNNDGVALAYRRPKHRHTPHSHTYQGALPNNVANTAGSYYVNDATFPSTSSVDGGSGNVNDPLDAPAYIVLNYIIRAKDV